MPPSQSFRRQLQRIARKHRDATDSVDQVLNDIRRDGVPAKAHRIPGLKGAEVYKLRVPIGGSGARAARLIFYYDRERLEPLFVYAKADTEDIPSGEILDALKAADLLYPEPGQRTQDR